MAATVVVAVALIVAVLVCSATLLRPMLRGGGLTLASGGPHPTDDDPAQDASAS